MRFSGNLGYFVAMTDQNKSPSGIEDEKHVDSTFFEMNFKFMRMY